MLVKHIRFISGLIIVAATIVGFARPAHAEKWIGVGDDWYVDADNRNRAGDIGTTYVRGPNNAYGFVSFDCKERKVISPESLANEVKQFENNSPLGKIYTTACKSWFEIWK